MGLLAKLFDAMTLYEADALPRVNHLMKVYTYAKFIGEAQRLDAHTQLVLETAALTHDIGIRPALQQYGSADGVYQQQLGPPVARQMLGGLGFASDVIDRVCFLIAHHHTYTNIDAPDYQILIEADFLVNIDEGGMSAQQIQAVDRTCFATPAGRALLHRLYPAAQQ